MVPLQVKHDVTISFVLMKKAGSSSAIKIVPNGQLGVPHVN